MTEFNNHYWYRYLEFCAYYKSNPPLDEVFTERHHIIPRSFIKQKSNGWHPDLANFSPDNPNIVSMPIRAHFIAHKMLVKAYPCRRTYGGVVAFAYCMKNRATHLSSGQIEKIRMEAREANRKAISKANRGRKLGAETKGKISKAHKGKVLSAETKGKISKARSKAIYKKYYGIYSLINKKGKSKFLTYEDFKMSDLLFGKISANYGHFHKGWRLNACRLYLK